MQVNYQEWLLFVVNRRLSAKEERLYQVIRLTWGKGWKGGSTSDSREISHAVLSGHQVRRKMEKDRETQARIRENGVDSFSSVDRIQLLFSVCVFAS